MLSAEPNLYLVLSEPVDWSMTIGLTYEPEAQSYLLRVGVLLCVVMLNFVTVGLGLGVDFPIYQFLLCKPCSLI